MSNKVKGLLLMLPVLFVIGLIGYGLFVNHVIRQVLLFTGGVILTMVGLALVMIGMCVIWYFLEKGYKLWSKK